MSANAARSAVPSAVPTLSSHFVTKKRGRGPKAPSFVSLRDTRPQWLYDAVHEAHQTDLPNDWVYRQCFDACRAIDDGALTDEDSLAEYSDGAVDIYTIDRFAWAKDLCWSRTFDCAERALEDMGGADDKCVADRLGMIQYCAIETIAGIVLRAYQESEGT